MRHEARRALPCDKCDKTFLYLQSLRKHIRLTNDKIIPKCDLCGLKVAELGKHKARKHSLSRTYLTCIECDKKFASKRNLKHHFQSVHEGVRFNCDQCKKTFTFNESLKSHVKTQHSGRSVMCDFCDFTTKRKDSLKLHVSVKHIKTNEVFSCKLCEFKGNNSKAVSNHKLREHNKRIFNCEQCQFTTQVPSSFRYHKQKHRDISFACIECNASFDVDTNLQNHMANIHGGTRECAKCDFTA